MQPGALLNSGRYRVLRRLNKGATAVVYAGEDVASGRQVALKVVSCASATKPVPLHIVQREVRLSSSIAAHDNVVQLLDVFAEGTELIIVWELVAGCDLLELLNDCGGAMTEAAAAFYFLQLLRAVLHLHAHGFCHRDIKPENSMVERATQRLLLIDFGLTKHFESVATLGVGTPDYMPPEMIQSQMQAQQQQQQQQQGEGRAAPPYDARAVDAWAMGVLLYLLTTGCYPYEDPQHPNNLARTILNIRAGRRQPLPAHISPGCQAVIAGLMCPDPQRRTRLEALAASPWLLQGAAAHAAKLGHISAPPPPLPFASSAGAIMPPQEQQQQQQPALHGGSSEEEQAGDAVMHDDAPGGAAPMTPAAVAAGVQEKEARGVGGGFQRLMQQLRRRP